MKFFQLSLLIGLIAVSCGETPRTADTKANNKPSPPITADASTLPEDTDTRKYVSIDGNKAKQKTAIAALEGRSDSKMSGKVKFTEVEGKVTMKARISNVNQGVHGFHIHAEGDCSAADGKSAGGHWNPTNEAHGKWGVPPFHRGDIGNFEADKNGNGSLELTTDLWCLGCGDKTKDIIGKAIIVHAGEDDCTSQPSGAAGARVACGVIEMN